MASSRVKRVSRWFWRAAPMVAAMALSCGGSSAQRTDAVAGEADAAVGPGDAAPADLAGARNEAGGQLDLTGPPDGAPPAPDAAAPPDAAQVPDAPVVVDNSLPDWGWFAKGAAVADRGHLAAAFATAGYTPPAGTYLLAARLEPGLDQPAYRYFSLAGSGFAFSAGVYWPASTIKVMAAVGALWTLSDYGLTGAAQVSFTDDDGSYSGTVKNLYDQALSVSSNVAYNRLAEIAGFDEMNDQYLVPLQGLPQMILQRRYTHPYPNSNLRTSPPISYVEGSNSGTIPARVGTGQHPSCPDEGNCITLFELMDVLRRVTLHDEIPAASRFPLAAADVKGLRAALTASSTFLEPGASQALGHPVEVYNKPGTVWNYDRLDHGLIVDTVTGARFLVAWSMPYNATSEAIASELTRQTLLALGSAPGSRPPPLQRDAGGAIAIRVRDAGPGATGQSRRNSITIEAPGADEVQVWVDSWRLPAPSGPSPHFELSYDFLGGGERLMVVRALQAGKLVAYRAAAVRIYGP